MADNDYICVYRQFFEEFAKTSQSQDCMPMRVNPYNLSVDELVGEVMQSCVNYLLERKCPQSLVVPLTKIVVEEFINEAKKQPEEVSTPLELNKKTHFKISEVCLRYTDNEKLSSLPGPVPETYYSTHSTKHTRRRMEDRLICLPRFNTLHCIETNSDAGYYGIFDGHSGVTAACYAVSHLHQFLAESKHYPNDPVQAFREAFEKTELKYNSKDENCGTAALAILHQHLEKKLTVAWVGDSQAMLVDEDSYVMLVDPHKPERSDERKRIEDLGGCLINIQSIIRVNGLLAISRAIGDKKLKPYISAEPEIRVVSLTGSEHFIVMGCDGLWDVVEPHQVIETVYFEVKKNEGQIDSVARRLVDLAKENNSTDNISVIVIFLTDPAEIKNRSIDVTGHRPKILHQDGVIMETNFQTNEKSPLGDPGMNGIYETNGNHFDIQNGSDEDFGPETDVDAVDDVLTSPKGLNPFSKDSWQKTGEENSEKLIEFTRKETKDFGDDFVKFSEEFSASVKPVDDNSSTQLYEAKSDKFSVDNVNPFDTPIVNKMSDVSNFSCNFTEDSNKYMDEINSGKDNTNPTAQSLGGELFDFTKEANVLDGCESKPSPDFCGSVGKDTGHLEQTVPNSGNPDLFFNEDLTSKPEESEKLKSLESPALEGSAFDLTNETNVKETLPNENSELQNTEANESANEPNEFRDLTSGGTNGAMGLIEQGVPFDDRQNPPELCSVIDIMEAAKVSQNPFEMEESGHANKSSELHSPTAPVTDVEAKDEIIAESGGEVEDSEDDEWDYIKVEPGSHQALATDNKASDSVLSPNESSGAETSTMNYPLNPEADEFIPVSAKANDHEFNVNVTPKKAIPGDLTDIIASSPNWSNMNNVTVPEEAAFLNEIKSRPSNIFENVDSPQQESCDAQAIDLSNDSYLIPTEDREKENEGEYLSSSKKLQGLDFASDMTSSFIDPSTISSDVEMVEEKHSFVTSPADEKVNNELVLGENAAKAEKRPTDAEVSSKLPDLLSPVSAQENFSLVDTSKPTEVEGLTMPVSEPVTSDSVGSPMSPSERKPVDTKEIISPASNEQPVSPPEALSGTLEKPSVEEKPNEAMSPKISEAVATAIGAAAAGVTAAAVATAKKDTKKPAPKTTTATSKAPATSKSLVNGTKTSLAAKKPTPTTRTSAPLKTALATSGPITKTTTTRVSSVTKTQPKSTTVSSTLTKTTTSTLTRPRLTSATPSAAKTSTPPKSTVTSSPTKPSPAALKSTTKTVGSTLTAASKPKPRVPSAPVEKKTATSLNGDAKPLVKRTEVTARRAPGVTGTTTLTTTRVSSSTRPATAPLKPMSVKTTVTTTRTVTAKPRTTVSSTTTSSTSSPSSKTTTTTVTKRYTIGTDKQAKEVANRITSRTGLASRPAGAAPTSTVSTTKTKKTLTTTTTTSKTKSDDKTETKAEKIVEVEVIRNENGIPLIENKTDINLINSITSEQIA